MYEKGLIAWLKEKEKRHNGTNLKVFQSYGLLPYRAMCRDMSKILRYCKYLMEQLFVNNHTILMYVC